MLVPHRALPRALSCALLLSATLRAEGPPPDLQLHYAVATECPTREWFRARVDEQLGEKGAPGGTLDVEIEANDGHFVGLGIFVDETGARASWERQLMDVDCEALLRAIALGVVLHWESALDPDAEGVVEPGPTERAADAPPDEEASASEAVAEEVTEPDEKPLDFDPLELPPPDVEERRPERGFYPAIGAGVGMRTGLNPTTDAAAAAHLGARGLGDHFRAGRYQLLVQWSFGNDTQGLADGTSAASEWRGYWWALGVHVCPWGQRNGNFVIAVCGDGQFVRYHAAIPNEGTAQAGWVSTVGPGLDAAVQLDGFGLRLDAGLDVPLVPARTLYRGSPVFRQGPGIHAIVSAEVFPWDPK